MFMTDHMTLNAVPRRRSPKKGWRLVNDPGKMDVRDRLEKLIKDDMMAEDIRIQAKKFLDSIVGERMPAEDFWAAIKLIRTNRSLNKKELYQLKIGSTAFVHAVFMACQACENLRDRTNRINSGSDRHQMMLQVASAITALGEVQSQLIGEIDDSKSQD